MNSKIIASLAAGLVCAASSLSVASAPDLSGTYNVATLTPLERPRALWEQSLSQHRGCRKDASR